MKNNGGPAFPFNYEIGFDMPDGKRVSTKAANPGMTMRQWYKGMALQGLMSMVSNRRDHLSADEKVDVMAKEAGLVADALLAEDAAHEEEGK